MNWYCFHIQKMFSLFELVKMFSLFELLLLKQLINNLLEIPWLKEKGHNSIEISFVIFQGLGPSSLNSWEFFQPFFFFFFLTPWESDPTVLGRRSIPHLLQAGGPGCCMHTGPSEMKNTGGNSACSTLPNLQSLQMSVLDPKF